MEMVSVVRCEDYEEPQVMSALRSVLEPLGGIERYVRQGTRVALKPNLLMKKDPSRAVTTHPSLIKALSLLIKEAGGSAAIMDGPGSLYSERALRGIYGSTGMQAVAEETGAELNYDLAAFKIDNPGGKYIRRLTVIKPLVDRDIIINVPKMKSHGQMVFTGAVKNMFGAIPGLMKMEYHIRMPDYCHFADTLIDIFLSVKPALNIMDAVVAMDGEGPSAGNPKKVGFILASENAFALDMAIMALVGVKPDEVPVLRCAIERGLCPHDVRDMVLKGADLERDRITDYRMPARESMITIHWVEKGFLRNALMGLKPTVVFNHSRCIGCGECARSCPAQTITMKNKKPHVHHARCIRCFCCQELCPERAVEIKRHFLTRFLLRHRR